MSDGTAVMIPEPMAVTGVSQMVYDKQTAFRTELEAAMPQLLAVVPKGVRANALASAALTAALDNPTLLDCEPLSMVRAVYKVAALGLRIGETADLVPTKKGQRQLAECWVRVKGTVELAIRSGAVQFVREGFVVDGDEFEHEERADGTHFRHKSHGTPALDASNVSHVYAIVTLRSGARVYEVWTRERVLSHKAKYAKNTRDTSPWNTHPLGMWAKCVVRAALRFAPLSPEVREAISEGDSPLPETGDPTEALRAGAGLMALGAGPSDDDTPIEQGDAPTAKQLAFLGTLMRSHVFTDAERRKVETRVTSKQRAKDAIEWAQAEMAKRKATEAADADDDVTIDELSGSQPFEVSA
jgi:recombination protein RecT